MLRLAITGGLCSGKSTVSALLRARGVPVVDADRLGHALLQTEAKAAVEARFGASILGAGGAIEAERLAERVFAPGGENELDDLNRILHPLIMARAEEHMREWERGGAGVAGVEAALLIEAGLLAGFDRVIVVIAEAELRIQRFIGRGGTRAQAQARMERQLPDAVKVGQADIVIENNGPATALVPQVERLLRRLGAGEVA